MEVNQDLVLKYLKRNFLAKSKQSDDEELYMFDYLIEKELMTLTVQGSAHINNYGKSFISNSNYLNPVPLTVHDWKMNIIEQLKSGKAILKGYGKLQEQAYDELKQDGVVEQVGRTYEKTLTTKGRNFINSGQSYNDFVNNINRIPNIINNNIYGNQNPINVGVGENVTQSQSITNIEQNSIPKEVIDKLLSFGIPNESIVELQKIYTENQDHENKPDLAKKILQWLGNLGTKAVEKGLELNMPLIIEVIHKHLL